MEAPTENKKRIFSAIQPSGSLTLGNYLGALRNWVKMTDEYDCIYSVADLHAITVRQEPAELRKNTLSVLATLIACGVDPERCILFVQSHVSEHSQMAWLLNCYTMFGELSRMTQFKDKSRKNADNINAGLFTYPALMAADILLYGATLVPVGADQKQHVEIARDIALRFNSVYGDVLTLPEGFIPKNGARVKSLTEPSKKMSKSDDNPNSYILITDPTDVIIKKFKRAVTDSDTEIVFKDGKDGINNLLTVYSAVTGREIADIESEFAGKGYGEFKLAVGETVAAELRPVREEYERLIKEKAYLEEVMKNGAASASRIAVRMLSRVMKKIGFVPPVR